MKKLLVFFLLIPWQVFANPVPDTKPYTVDRLFVNLETPHGKLKVGHLESVISTVHRQAAIELTCLALNVYHESRGEPQKEQIGTAYVVLNRQASTRYPNTVCSIVWQYKNVNSHQIGQFSWTTDSLSDKPRNNRAWKKAQKIAHMVYNGIVDDPTHGATHYYAHNKVNPNWAQGASTSVRLASHTYLSVR